MEIISESTYGRYVRTVGKSNEVDKMMRLTLFIQRVFGQHVLDPEWTLKTFVPYQIFFVLLIIYVFFGTMEILKNTNDVAIVAEACYTFVICTFYQWKNFLFIINRHVFQKLYVELKTTLFDMLKTEPKENLDNTFRLCTKVIRLSLSIMVFLPVIVYFMKVLWYYVNGERLTLSKTTSILVPMETPYHEIATILHFIFMFHAAFTIIFVDIWFVLFLYFFGLASDNVVKMVTVEGIRPNESKAEYSERLNNSLRYFYKVHAKQIQFLCTLNVMFKWLSLAPLCSITCCSCIILLLLSKGADWAFLCNIVPVFGELVAFNWFGEQLKTKGKNIKEALLNFDWINLKTKDKKTYYLIISCMREYRLTTAIGSDLSFITMSAVLRTSYEAFTVLSTLDN